MNSSNDDTSTFGRSPRPSTIHRGLAVYRFGAGEPVLLMPGPHRYQRPGTRSADALIEGLIDVDRQVITFDPPGVGASTRTAELTIAEMHDCATESLGVSGAPGSVDVLGHSMGGLATLAYALEHPARVASLVLVGTGTGGPAYMNAPGALWNRSHPQFWKLALLGVLHIVWPRLATERLLNNFIDRHSFYDRRYVDPDSVRWRDLFRPKEGRPEWHRVARKLDYSERLDEIDVPTLILCGRHDPQYPPACSKELAHGIRDSQLVYFDRSGHYPFIEEPGLFWRSVDEFLAST